MTPKEIIQIKKLLGLQKNIVITTHHNPDGDAIGSSLGLYNFLIRKGYKADVITPNNYPEFLHWLPGNDKVIIYKDNTGRADELINSAGTIFCLDYNALNRVGDMGSVIKKSDAVKILIDHHPQPDDFADYKLVDTSACSAAELVYEFIELLNEKHVMNKDAINCIYTGIMTDTGAFRFGTVSSKTHKVVSVLIELGADRELIHGLIYNNFTQDRMRLLGYCLNEKLKVFPQYGASMISLSIKELERYNFKKGDSEGFVNYALAIKNVRLAAFIVERDDIVKLSFRSTGDFSVDEFARKHFAGGGHSKAAGGESKLSLEETIEKFISILPQYKDELLLCQE
ncbi:MAG: bifunctional oligoribonuclease/PAP phosphatase NrnA [Bacteroidota bacterium]